MEQFLTPKLEKEVSEISLEYIYENEKTYMDIPDFVERSLKAKGKMNHIHILAGWMADGLVQYDTEAWQNLQRNYLVSAYRRMAELKDMIVHASIKKESPFNLLYCPEKMQDYQVLRTRLWWEYFTNTNKICKIGQVKSNDFVWYNNEEDTLVFLEEQKILDDAYIRVLAKKFYPEEYK